MSVRFSSPVRVLALMPAVILWLSACGGPAAEEGDVVETPADSAIFVAVVEGFSGPEAVRYDANQDVFFVANFNGSGGALDNNGFISRVLPDGAVDSLRFIEGGQNNIVLHAPRGMTISGDTLWACDVDAVRGFNRFTGEALATVDFSDVDVGFLNDVARGPDGSLYVTDTGRDTIYRIAAGHISVAVTDSLLDSPNGITWDSGRGHFLVVPFGGTRQAIEWQPGADSVSFAATVSGAQMDGVEVVSSGAFVISTQADSSLHLVTGDGDRIVAHLDGRPADIGYDPQRNRIAVPYVSRNVVEIWQLPE